jgi:hypothetical protein
MEVDHAVECFTGPLRRYFYLLRCIRDALKLQGDVQDHGGSGYGGLESIGQDLAITVG